MNSSSSASSALTMDASSWSWPWRKRRRSTSVSECSTVIENSGFESPFPPSAEPPPSSTASVSAGPTPPPSSPSLNNNRIIMATTATWQDRLRAIVGPNGYDSAMRRSLQTCILYEAKRIVAPHLQTLRPFQRKFAFMDQAHALLESLDFLSPIEKEQVFYRTMCSQEIFQPDVAWKRAQSIDKELELLAQQVKPFCTPGRTHEQAVDRLVQDLYNKQMGEDARARGVPLHWEHAHKHHIMTFRLYYHLDQFDPTFPAPVMQKELTYPLEKPRRDQQEGANQPVGVAARAAMPMPHLAALAPTQFPALFGGNNMAAGAALNMLQAEAVPAVNDVSSLSVEDRHRRNMLSEVREHLELLKEFEGAISPEDLAERKRQLFMSLPPAPPPASVNKKPRT